MAQKVYKAGEKSCEVCGRLLGEIRCGYGKKHFTCGRPECKLKFPRRKDYQTIGEQERRCEGPRCSNFAPAGTYPARKFRFFCSKTCSNRFFHRNRKANPNTHCLHCGEPITASTARFCPGHYVLYRREQRELQRCGPFLDLYRTHVRDFAWGRYNPPHLFVYEVTLFLSMLTVLDIKVIDEVTPVHVRYFLTLTRYEKEYPRDREKRFQVLFEHLISAGLYHSSNPFDRPSDAGDQETEDDCTRALAGVDDYSWLPRSFIPIQLIRPQERPCAAKGCVHFVQGGAYPADQRLFFCSGSCRARYYATGNVGQVQCAYPGCKNMTWFKPDRGPDRCYCTKHSRWQDKEARDRQKCGVFYPLFQGYFQKQANGHYETTAGARSEIREFFALLNRKEVVEINGASPEHIEDYLNQCRETNEAPRADYVKKLFDYLIECGGYRHENPVMSRVHYEKRSRRESRPYSQATMAEIWRILEKRGCTLAKLLIAFGEESGPRAINICRCMIFDVDLENNRV